MQSGTAFLPAIVGSSDPDHTNFTFVASKLGYANLNSSSELDCLRALPVNQIVDFVGNYGDNMTSPGLAFGPVTDEKIIFSNYTQRYERGLMSNIPAIVSNAANEGASLVAITNFATGPEQNSKDEVTLSDFICPSHKTSILRTQNNLITYRYQYAGNFTNISPRGWLGAYHDSDLPMLFGTYDDFRGAGPSFEAAMSQQMQDLVLTFMRDPFLESQSSGWVNYADVRILRFAVDGKTTTEVPVRTVDGACYGSGHYNPSP